MNHGARSDIENNEGKTPAQVAFDENIRKILGGAINNDTAEIVTKAGDNKFVPNYLQHPAFNHKVDLTEKNVNKNKQPMIADAKEVEIEDFNTVQPRNFSSFRQDSNLIILKIRIADCLDKDFIEIDMEDNQLNFQNLKVSFFVFLSTCA